MLIHFVCRGNAFRSIIAEAYLNSLQLPDFKVISSGTVADVERPINFDWNKLIYAMLRRHGIEKFAKQAYGDQLTQERVKGNDIIVCVNQLAYEEFKQLVDSPTAPLVWDVADINEPGRIVKQESDRLRYAEDVYKEIAQNVNKLVEDLT